MDGASGLKETILSEISSCLISVSNSSIDAAIDKILGAPRVFCAGAGRSGFAVRGFAMRLMHLGLPVYVMGDTTTPAIQKNDLLVIGSGSGRTGSLLTAAQKASSVGANIALFTIDDKSPIAEIADHIVIINAPSEKLGIAKQVKSVQPMGTLFEQVLAILFDCIIAGLMKKKDLTSGEMFARHANLE